jgi:UDPglucose 6-dehydrogenase
MKVGIIGYGYVGRAIAQCYNDIDLVVRDPKLKHSAELSDFNQCDAVFICVPSPSNEDGSCDTSILEQTIRELLFTIVNKQIPIICKTTAPPSVYQRLLDQFPNIVHVPEFLTAANHIQDYFSTEYVILGGHDEWCEEARKIINGHLGVPRYACKSVDIKTAALYKYMMNSYLAAKVSFMNEFAELAKAENVWWNDIVELASYDQRIGLTHMDVPGPDGQYGWGGACFPKDVAAIIKEAENLNVDFTLMKDIIALNNKHRK